MNLRFAEAFFWVASLKSMSRAAEKLFITQSAMSSRIAALEEELGALLLDRRDKQIRLTVAGSRFLVDAERLLAMQREIKSEMGSAAARALSLRLGAIEPRRRCTFGIDRCGARLRRQHACADEGFSSIAGGRYTSGGRHACSGPAPHP